MFGYTWGILTTEKRKESLLSNIYIYIYIYKYVYIYIKASSLMIISKFKISKYPNS